MDIIDAKRNMKTLCENEHDLKEALKHLVALDEILKNYNHLFSSYAFKQECILKLNKVKEQISNIEWQLKQVR